jgi:hypothetical protein
LKGERTVNDSSKNKTEEQYNFRVLDHDSCNNCDHACVLTGIAAYMWQCGYTGKVYGYIENPPSNRMCNKYERSAGR